MRIVVLVLAALALTLPGIFSMPAMDRDESRYVQATKQMAETGDYIDIRFQDAPRYKKPVGIYWMQSAAVAFSGQGPDAPLWVYRTVSVLGSLIAVLGLYWTGARLFGPAGGLAAALALAAMFGTVFEARVAKTDAMLLASAVLAQGALVQIYTAARGLIAPVSWLPWMFWGAMALGVLIKGPIVPMLTALTLAPLVFFDRDRAWLRDLQFLRGLALFAAIVLPWFVLITLHSGWAFWAESLGADFLGKAGSGQSWHAAPPGYYVLTYSLYTFPFASALLLAGLAMLNRMRAEPVLLFLACWYLPFWLVFEIAPTKLPHYVIPAYPALALALGWALGRQMEGGMPDLQRWQLWLYRFSILGVVLVPLGLGGLAIFGPIYMGNGFEPFGVIAAVAFALAAWFGWPRARQFDLRRIGIAAGASVVAYRLLFAVCIPAIERIWMTPRLHAAYVEHRLCADTVLASVRYHEPSLVFRAGTGTVLTDAAGAAGHLLERPECALAFVPRDEAETVGALVADAGRSVELLAEVEGINYSKGDELLMELYRIRPQP